MPCSFHTGCTEGAAQRQLQSHTCRQPPTGDLQGGTSRRQQVCLCSLSPNSLYPSPLPTLPPRAFFRCLLLRSNPPLCCPSIFSTMEISRTTHTPTLFGPIKVSMIATSPILSDTTLLYTQNYILHYYTSPYHILLFIARRKNRPHKNPKTDT